MTHVTFRLTAENRDQIRNSALGNRVWATFIFFLHPSNGITRLLTLMRPILQSHSDQCPVFLLASLLLHLTVTANYSAPSHNWLGAWGKGGNVTSAGWQVTLCDPMWHVSSRSGVATLQTAIHLLHTYLLTYLLTLANLVS